ncbi:tetratricopeptide repeat protein [Thalassoroseus pseudoceratinae]|uniref:tetratricopeptide repeat protein n=1 Tax=Thalassoroseus pseudoceratinae TaxID=2713176 RepID=UPI00141E80AA|nr:tetratricopeptide repeat protein [Thalassoroseus pseudoceratinae]
MSTPANDSQRHPIRELVVILTGVLLVVGIVLGGWWYASQADPTPSELDEARVLLDEIKAGTNASARLETAQKAEQKLRQFLQEESNQEDAADLLLLAARLIQSPVENLEGQVDRIDLSLVPTPDLATMAFITLSVGQHAIADQVISEAVTRTANDRSSQREQVLRLAAMIRYELGRRDEVLAHCHELIELAPEDPGPYRVMAFVYEDRQETKQLAEALRQLIQRTDHPADDPFQLKRVEALITLGETAAARKEFDTLEVESLQISADAPMVRAKLLELEGRLDEASVVANRVLAERPDDVDALSLLARVNAAQGDLDAAIDRLRRVLELTPSDEKVHYQLGKILARQGKLEEAQTHIDRHRELLDTKVLLNRLEHLASQRPADIEIRKRIAKLYRSLSWEPEARFWDHAAEAAASFGQ